MLKERELEIIRQVQEGNTSVYSELVDHYKDAAFTLSVRICGNRDDAADICQEAFIKAFRALNNFRAQSGFSTWLYRIVYNTAISHLRSIKIKTSPLDGLHEIASDDETGMDDSMRKLVRKLVAGLPEVDRTIVTLYYLMDHSISEIAEIISISESNIKVRLHRSRMKLHEELSLQLDLQTIQY